MDVFTILGDALNGVFQVVVDFVNLIISLVPNPDPFPALIASMPDAWLYEYGFAVYWIDNLVGVSFMEDALNVWATMMVAGAVFAGIYWGIKAIRG